MLLLALLACGSNNMFVITCPETTEVIAPSDDTALGFSPAEARALVPADQTLAVRWDGITHGPTEETFTVALSPAGDPLLVEKQEGNVPDHCRLDSSIRVPLSVEISAFGGDLVGTFPGQIDAWSLDELSWGMSDHADVTLTGEFVEEADTAVQEQRPDTEVTRWRFVLGGTPTGGEVDLEYEWKDERSQGIAVLLWGTWGDAVVE